jgi:hypothetical protein
MRRVGYVRNATWGYNNTADVQLELLITVLINVHHNLYIQLTLNRQLFTALSTRMLVL